MIRIANNEGYVDENAEAKVCQDIVLKALAESTLSRNVTIKGGVVMRSISKNSRRATQDIDFIRYSLSDDSIRSFIGKMGSCYDGVREGDVVLEKLKSRTGKIARMDRISFM
jgi:predicted nucleotidyltransferase component of viral defense system